MKSLLTFLLLFHANYFVWANSMDKGPWIDTVLQPIYENSTGYEYFKNYKINDHKEPARKYVISCDNSLYFAVNPDWAGEIEVFIARTKGHSWVIDGFQETLQYVIWDDSRGDPLAFSFSGTLSEVPDVALKNPARFHLGNFEANLKVLMGKEWSEGEAWLYRVHGGIELMVASRGTLGAGGYFTLQHKRQIHIVEGSLKGAWGGGSDRLRFSHFKGYGRIAYRFLDVIFSYAYLGYCDNIFKFDLFTRVAARNFPSGNIGGKIEWSLPFNL